MAVGSAVQGVNFIQNGSYLKIQPTSPNEYLIQNIYAQCKCEIYFTNGTDYVLVEKLSPYKSLTNRRFRCTNLKYYAIKNVDDTGYYIAYDGVQVK